MGKSKNDKKDDGGWPWLDGAPDPTDNKVIEKIVYWFPYYAVYGKGKLYLGNEDEKRIARTFLACCEYGSVVRNYFKENANHIDTPEARNIADGALDLVDEFYDWFQKKEQDLESYNKLSWSWRKEFRRFNMCMNSDNQAKKPGETGQKDERSKIMITAKTSKENWEAIKSEYDISKKDFGKKINFVSDSFKRKIIFRDVEHAFVLASQAFSKPALILAGGVIEELLRLYLENKNIQPKCDKFFAYIEACENNKLLKRGVSRLTDSIRDFRNLVHLANEETKKHTISKATAKGAVSSIFTVANDF